MFSIEDILKATNGRLISGDTSPAISGISTDTRTIKPGDLFIALKGKNFDGHNFIEEAIKKGASGAIVSVGARFTCPERSRRIAPVVNGFDKSNPDMLFNVKDTLKAYGDIAHFYRMKFNIPLIGVTGSNGKTTVKEMIYRILEAGFKPRLPRSGCVLKNEGTENNLIGLPQTLLRLDSSHQIGILELGTNHFGEIRRLSQILKPTVGLITNIGPSHLEFLRSEAEVFKEKAELLNSLDKDGTAIINADDARLSKIKRLKCKIVKFGIAKTCDFRAAEIFCQNDGIRFIVNGKYDFKIRILGGHNIYNALAAIAVGFLYKVDYDNIYKALLEFKPVHGRMCLKRFGGLEIIDDTYNSNPQSLKIALEVLANYKTPGRKIFVCGDMLELGDSAVRFHNEAGKAIADKGIDYLISVGTLGEVIKDAAILNGMHKEGIFSCRDNFTALKILKKILKENDVVLLKGSRFIKLDEVVNALLSFISTKRDMVRL